MSNEGYILTIEGSPYAFSTNGITGLTPTHESWAPTWTLMENVLVNPNDYISWNERTLPIEGDLEVDGITFKLLDKHVESFTLYDSTTFTGNILTELFTRGSARQTPYYIERSFGTISRIVSVTLFNQEVSLFSDPGLPATATNANYRPTIVSASYDLSAQFVSSTKPIWVEDEAIMINNYSATDPKVLEVGMTYGGGENTNGRGIYGTEKKYHYIKDTYKPEIYLKHPLVIKRGIILWRVQDVTDVSSNSIYPIWRGYCQSSPQLTVDGSTFEIRAEHKWNVYKNEVMDYAGFKHKFDIPDKTYSRYAMMGIFASSLNFNNVLSPYIPDDADWGIKFTTSPIDAFLCIAQRAGFIQPSLRQRIFDATNNSVFTYRVYPGSADPINTVTVNVYANDPVLSPSQYKIGGRVNGKDFWSSIVDHPDQTLATSPILPPVAIDYKQNLFPSSFGGYSLKYSTGSRTNQFLPNTYLNLLSPGAGNSRFGGTAQVNIRHIFVAENEDNVVVLEPAPEQPIINSVSAQSLNVITGRITERDKKTFKQTSSDGTQMYIDKNLSFKTGLSAQSTTTTIETIFKTILRPRSSVTVFNNVNINDFDTSNLEELNDWVSGIEPTHDIRWLWTPDTKFVDYINPYMKLFNYIICLQDSKIKFKTYDSTRAVDHTLVTADFLEAPVNLSTLPENLFNTIKLTAPNYDTTFTFNDDLSKGRYKIGNAQEVELPAVVEGIANVNDLITYFQDIATRFLSIWGYPQYVFKCKCSLEKININIGDIVSISDWLVPNFDAASPLRGLVNKPGIVIERNVDLTTGVINFSIVYGEKFQTSKYSPCIRVETITNDVGLGISTLVASSSYIRPSNKLQPLPTAAGGYGNTEELSTYAGSNRYPYRLRYNPTALTTEDGGVSPFSIGDHVELILRDSSTNLLFSGSATPLIVTNVTATTKEIKLNQTIPSSFTIPLAAGAKIDLRFANYDECVATQQDEYGWIGDFTFESLDNPLPVPPALRQVAATQLAP